jgi:hypothetical protein
VTQSSTRHRHRVPVASLCLADAAKVWREFIRLESFGYGNPEPRFSTRARVLTPWVATSTRLCRMSVEQHGRIYQFKYFGPLPAIFEVSPGDCVHLVYRLREDLWRSGGFSFVLESLRSVADHGSPDCGEFEDQRAR